VESSPLVSIALRLTVLGSLPVNVCSENTFTWKSNTTGQGATENAWPGRTHGGIRGWCLMVFREELLTKRSFYTLETGCWAG